MTRLKNLARDLVGISRVLGFGHAIRWIVAIVASFPTILAARNLQSADRAMGIGPFRIAMHQYGVAFRVIGQQAFSGIREMYVRDVYLNNGTLQIRDGDIVLDLGANMGNFTNLALAHGDNVRVIAVEPGRGANDQFWRSVSLNIGFGDRVTLVQSLLGEPCARQEGTNGDSQYQGAHYMTESELIQVAGIERVDFLKCDIEGGEFALLGPNSRLLELAKNLAVEVHSFAGNVETFIQMLGEKGFEIRHVKRDPDGTATVLAARRGRGESERTWS